jgi:hypothetical protein
MAAEIVVRCWQARAMNQEEHGLKGAMHSKASALTLVDCWLSAGSKRCPSRHEASGGVQRRGEKIEMSFNE